MILRSLVVLLAVISTIANGGNNIDKVISVHKNNHQARNRAQKQAHSSTNSPRSMRNSNFKVTALVEKSVTLTCSIDLDDKEFLRTASYKIIWSREIENGRDYEPLALDDTRLVSDSRFDPTRLVINKPTGDQIQWNLVINNLKLSDSNNYICQLNQRPYDVYWLKKFTLNVYEPASFIDDIQANDSIADYENSIFVKSVNELDDFKLRCNSKGRPKPTVTWFLRYMNGTQIQLHIDSNEIVIKSIKKSSKIDRVECQINNGYGATATRSYKINIRHRPYMHTKSKLYRVPQRTHEIRLNCSVYANPIPQVQWYFLPNELVKSKLLDNNRAVSGSFKNGSSSSRFGFDEIELNDSWKPINLVASYSFKHINVGSNEENYHDDLLLSSSAASAAAAAARSAVTQNSTYSIVKLPLSKYQIFERRNVNHVASTLEIKLINDKDFGLYRCVASNELGNQSVDFRIQELNYESVNTDRMRSLLNREREKAGAPKTDSANYEENYTGVDEDDEDDDVRESSYYYDKSRAAFLASHPSFGFLHCLIILFSSVFILGFIN